MTDRKRKYNEVSSGPDASKKRTSAEKKRKGSSDRNNNSSNKSKNSHSSPPPKSKKPKHLKRKIAQAEEAQDTETLRALQAEQEKLTAAKQADAAKWLETCRALVGPEKWDQELFDKLVAAGTSKAKFITALGVDQSKSSSSLLPAPKKLKSKKTSDSRSSKRGSHSRITPRKEKAARKP